MTHLSSPAYSGAVVQDYGWAGAGWHNSVLTGGQREVQTPHMDKLVATGIELNQHYTFKFCSPTRSSLQSGRNPIHVNVQNVNPDRHNPEDPVAGFSAIARNMTGMAVHMKAAGWRTAAVGKWDAGMATADHTPLGRGYEQSLIYFHHANDYWQYTCGSCTADGSVVEQVGLTAQERQELDLPPLPPEAPFSATSSCASKFTILPETGVCKHPGSDLWHGPVEDQDECCARCAAAPACVGWTHQYRDPEGKNISQCFTCNGTSGGPTPGRTSGCVGQACNLASTSITDLWSGSNPAHSMKPPTDCSAQTSNLSAPWPQNASCIYEDALFEAEVQRIVAMHPLPQPLFLFWAPHIVRIDPLVHISLLWTCAVDERCVCRCMDLHSFQKQRSTRWILSRPVTARPAAIARTTWGECITSMPPLDDSWRSWRLETCTKIPSLPCQRTMVDRLVLQTIGR